MKKIVLNTPESMMAFGTCVAALMPKQGSIIYLCGPLGAGKTTWVRGFLRGLNFNDNVKSPTYTLVESYTLDPVNVHHFDFYRLKSPAEIEFLGIEDYFEKTYCLIEWPEKAHGALPSPDLLIQFEIKQDVRVLTLKGFSPEVNNLLDKL